MQHRFIFYCFAGILITAGVAGRELERPSAAHLQVDRNELNVLNAADAAFSNQQYQLAFDRYDAFVNAFPGSIWQFYAMFREARCLELNAKQLDAIARYREFLDHFPNEISYAASALYQMGLCHQGLGDPESALKVWHRLIDDKDYCRDYQAAAALNMLGRYFQEEDPGRAVGYYRQVVKNFRKKMPAEAHKAIGPIIEYWVKAQNEQTLHAFYVKAEGFDLQPHKITDSPEDDLAYWNYVRKYVRRCGRQFGQDQAEQRYQYYQYWASIMAGRYPDFDDYQIDFIDFSYAYETNSNLRFQRLTAQFNKYQRPNDSERIVKWIGLCRNNKKEVGRYYSKLDLYRLSSNPGLTQHLLFVLLEQGQYDFALQVFDGIALGQMDDAAREELFVKLRKPVRAGLATRTLEQLSASFSDKDYGAMLLLRYFYWVGDIASAIAQAELLTTSPRYSEDVYELMGVIYFNMRDYEAALDSYRHMQHPPVDMIRIAEEQIE